MVRLQYKISLLVILCLQFSVISQAESLQLFLVPPSENICPLPSEVQVYALNEKGEVDSDFEGKKKIKVTVKEEGGIKENSFSISLDKIIKFKRGKSSFSLHDSEPETLNVSVEVEKVKFPAAVKLLFEDKDVFPPLIETIMVEKANIIVLKFSEEIEDISAEETDNYKAVTNKREVHPKKVEYHKDYVILEFPQDFDKDEEGYIEVEGIEDLNENEVISGTRSPDFKGDCGC